MTTTKTSSPIDQTPEARLATALRDAEGPVMRYQDDAENIAPAVLAADPTLAADLALAAAAKVFVSAQRAWHAEGHSSLTHEGYLLMDAVDAAKEAERD